MKIGTFRRVAQGSSLALILFLFARTAYPLHSPLPVDLLLRFDPLAAVVSFLAARAIVLRMFLSLVLLGATVLLGRFFCGSLCPLGTIIDLSDGFLSRLGFRRFHLSSLPRSPKYFVLIFLLTLAAFGRSALWLFDPLVIFTRSLTALFFPASVFLANQSLDVFRPLAEHWQLDVLANASLAQPVFSLWALPLVLLVLILGLGFFGRRFWCRALCPLGALLALAGRSSPLQRLVARGACHHCGLCRKHCSMGAIEEDETQAARWECIECGLCASICPQQAVSFKPIRGLRKERGLDWDRRRLVGAALAGVMAIPIFKLMPRVDPSRPLRIRPPGSVPEEVFLNRCLRCGECMKACLTNGLQPSIAEAGPGGLWTPVLIPRQGPCERYCHLCGQVCPTQAIRALSLEEKSYVRIGQAQVDRSRCLEWAYGRACLVCDEVCPYGAISVGSCQEPGRGRRGPVVDPQICVGCGVCEHHCPVLGEAAIRVSAQGEDRLLRGSYVTPQRQAARQQAVTDEGAEE